MGILFQAGRMLLQWAFGYAGGKLIETKLAAPETVINDASAKSGIPSWVLWLLIAVGCFFSLRYFFKQKS